MRRTGAALLATLALSAPALAEAPEISPRPVPRAPDTAASDTPAPAQAEAAAKAAVVAATPPPRPRPEVTLSTKNMDFRRWIQSFRGRALAQGVGSRTFDTAFEDVEYNTDVISRDRNQSEFTKTIWDYLDSAASPTRIENGRAAIRERADLLRRLEAEYGVEKEVVVAIWGLESAYGSHRGSTPIVEALATLAHDGRRGRFFEAQLVAALKILDDGDVQTDAMTGSWAGAMGHTQFIPTSYLTYAVDFTGDGKRDIWSDNPADALASTAAYLDRFGWQQGMPWGVEVTLPKGFDYTLANRDETRLPSDWAELGVMATDGRPVKDYGKASILLPAGARGAAFMIFQNFAVLERYNTADAYVIGVGHLSDRLAGAGPIQHDWPRGDRALTFAERKEMQEDLTARGFDTKGVDGKVGPLTIKAIRNFQRANGLIPDGYASLALLERLR